MSEDTKEEAAAAAAATAAVTPPRMSVLSQYIRDMSFENIAAQKGTVPQGKPEFKVQVGLDAKKAADNDYHVIIKLNVESAVGEDKMFILEVEYAGRFRVENVPEAQLHPYLLIECPRMIFPYLRRIVSDVTQDGGFMPLNLDGIDFVQLYRQELLRRAQAQGAAGATPGPSSIN